MAGLYTVERILGHGATAVVVRATRIGDPGRSVALKVLRSDGLTDRRALARAADEAALLRQLQHPNLLHVHHLLSYRGRVVIESEFVDGIGLDAALRRGPLTGADAVHVALQVALGLDACYSTPSPVDGRPLRIVHRDLKPGNVLLTREGGVKVVDFGLASSRFTPLEPTPLRGTPGYTPPEPLTGADRPAVDIYALGMILTECLLGRAPVVSKNPSLHDVQMDAGIRRIGRLDLPPGVGSTLMELLRTMLRYDPEARPPLDDVLRSLMQLTVHPAMHPDPSKLVRRRRPASSAPAQKHPEWPTVAFLEEELPDPPPKVRPAAEVEQEVRRRLRTPGWTEDLPALRELLASADAPIETPFLDLLRPRGWQFWRRPIGPEEKEGALLLLAVDPSPEAVRHARRLCTCSHPRIAEAARKVLDRA